MRTSVALEADILNRVIRPDDPTFSRKAAEGILALTFGERDRQRMAELVAKSRKGALTPQEHAEAESYERVSSLLGMLKSKARRSLGKASSGK